MHDIDRLAAPGPAGSKRGRGAERPWGTTLAAFGIAGRTGQLTLRSPSGKVHAIAFIHGAVVGATSPLIADGVARIAQRSRIVTARQVASFTRARRGQRVDDLAAFVEAMGLAPDQKRHLEERVLLLRAARTFAIDRGDLSIEPRISIPVAIGTEVDVRAVVYHGARLVLDGERLTTELRGFGKRFRLTTDSTQLARFGFGDLERPVLEALRTGTSGPELEALHRDLDPRMVQAVIYALAACGAVVAQPDVSSCVPTAIRRDPSVPRPVYVPTRAPETVRAPTARGTRKWTEPFLDVRPTTVRPNALAAPALRALIAAGREMLEQGVDHFTMLGVPIGASVEAVRTAYVELARNLRPERLAELRIRDLEFNARGLLAQICIAYTVLTEPARRGPYIAGLGRGGAAIDFAKLAAEAFRRGEHALRGDEPERAIAELRTACELVPDDIDYLATLARAEFSAAAHKRR